MKLREKVWLRSAMRVGICTALICLAGTTEKNARAQAVSTTTVQGTVYLANGQAGSGTLVVSWPAFTTAAGQLVAADNLTVRIPADGFLSVNLAPNQGATPAGEYYTAVLYMSDGTVHTQYWVIPAAAQASLAQVQAQVMPAAQAVQAVNKSYVDQAVAQALTSQITVAGGNLTGPLYLSGDPTQPMQAADKHYVDSTFSTALPLTGGSATGPLTATKLGGAYQVDQFPGADFGAKLQACLNTVDATYGGTCDARNFMGTLAMGTNLTLSTPNTTVQLPCATIATANQMIVTAGTRNVSLRGCALRGGSAANGSLGGTVFDYSGTGPMVQVGDPAYLADTPGFHLDNVVLNTTGATSASAQGLAAYRTQELDIESVYFLGNSNQTGMTLDGTGNYTGGTFFDDAFNGFATAVNAIGHQVTNAATTDWLNASTFVRLHIVCPMSGGSPMAGTIGINLQQGDGNTLTGGDVEGCSTALHLGANAQNNTILGLRNENSTNQVVADAGSTYNNWITGGTMFTGKLADSGTRNSFLDTFHRSFNGVNGDWYGSQQDATVTNHYRLGTGTGNERGLLNRYQTDYGYRWTTGLTDATAGEQFYQLRDELNNVDRFSVGQYLAAMANTVTNVMVNNGGCYSTNTAPAVSFSGGTGSGAAGIVNMVSSSCSGGWTVGSVTVTNNGSGYTSRPLVTWSGGSQISAPSAVAEISTAGSTNNQTALNSAGTGAVVLNGSTNAGTGGVVFGSGGANETTVATINNAGNALFNGTLQVGGTSTFTGSATVKNQADAEIDAILQAGVTTSQKESVVFRDWNGASQWYMVKDQNNNLALNSATGNLDSFKAYQSTNSGDTYINAANSSGVVRVNYENGAGSQFNIYGGNSTKLYASFSGTNAIKFPGMAAASGVNCLQVDNSGYISNTGMPCGTGSGGSGTVGSGLSGQIAYYTGNGTAVGGMSTIPVSAGGTGAITAAGALANLLPGAAPDGNNGMAVSGAVAQDSAVTKSSPAQDIRAYGAKIDGSTDIGSALTGATAACNASNGNACETLLPCGGPNGCYLNNGSAFNWSGGTILKIREQGNLKLGSTLVIPDRVTWECDGGGGNGQFQYAGSACDIIGPNVNGTLGTAVTTTGSAVTFTPTYTNGSSANFHVNSAITVAGVQTCSATASRTFAAYGPNTVFTLSGCTDSSGNAEGPRTPVGSTLTVTGCSDSSFNITATPVIDQDWPNNTETVWESGATATATGCTLTGFDDNTFETVSISAVAGGTMTATFAHKHAASDLYGMVAVTFPTNSYNHHDLQGVAISSNGGAALWLDSVAEVNLDSDSFGASSNGLITSFPVECDGCWQGSFDKDTFFAWGPFQCHSNCAVGYPYSIRCSQDSTRENGIGCQFIQISNSTLIGGLKVDGNGMANANGVGPQIGPLQNDIIEQTARAAVTVDPRLNTSLPVSVSMNSTELQDNFQGNTQYYVAGTDCCVNGFANMGDLPSYASMTAVLANKYWPQHVTAKNMGQSATNPGSINPRTGFLTDGDSFMGIFDGSNAGLSPAVIPYPTLAVTTNPTCSTCVSVTGPDGVANSALEVQADGSGNFAAVTVGTSNQATYAGDWIIFGARVKPGNLTTGWGDPQWGANALYIVQTSGTDTFVAYPGAVFGNTIMTGGGILPMVNGTWQPGVQIAQIATGETTAHTLSFKLYSNGGLAHAGNDFYDWYWMYVPGPNNPAYTGVTQQEVVRWAQEMAKGYTPSSGTTGVMYASPNFKLQWGTGPNLYDGPSGNVKTDNAFDAVQGYKCNGSYGTNGQFLQTTGSGCQWATSTGSVPAAPAWLLYQGDGSDGAYSCTTGTCSISSGDRYYSSFSISAGATVQGDATAAPMVIRSTGTCTVAGTLTFSLNTGTHAVAGTTGGSSGGGGGGGTAAGSAGGSVAYVNGGAAGAASGGTGGAGGNFLGPDVSRAVATLGVAAWATSTANVFGGAKGGAGGSSGGAGGWGGGGIVLDCQTINFTGAIDSSGQAGGASTGNNIGAGGGGGGGFVILRSQNLTNSGTINVAGGAGGSCGAFTGCGAGGAGGNGWWKQFSQ